MRGLKDQENTWLKKLQKSWLSLLSRELRGICFPLHPNQKADSLPVRQAGSVQTRARNEIVQSLSRPTKSVLLAGLGVALALVIATFPHTVARAQEQYQFERDLEAKHRLYREVGASFRQIQRGPNGDYYILTAPGPEIRIYDASGKQTGQIPSPSGAGAKGAEIVYGESFDVDHTGRIVVADRGDNAVKIYSPSGVLTTSFHVKAPVSVVFLPGDEIAMTSPESDRLVTVYDLTGKVVRDYGDREEIADRADINTQVNYGRLVADDAGNNYFYFEYLPEPTVRKFDRVGYLSLEIALKTLEFEPAAQAARKAIARSQEDDKTVPSLHQIISAVGVDPQSQELWVAIGTLLMQFDKDGQRLYSFRTYLPGGTRIEPSQILVEPNRLILGADPQGIYEFPKPEKIPK